MPTQFKVVSGFGGGLNFSGHPAAMRDDEWSWCDGWSAQEGTAEAQLGYEAYQAIPVGVTAITGPYCMGIVPDLWNQGFVQVWGGGFAPNTIRMFSGTGTEITQAAGVAGDTAGLGAGFVNTATNNDSDQVRVLTSGFFNGKMVFSLVTSFTSGSVKGLWQWAGGATYQLINGIPTAVLTTLTGETLLVFGNRLVLVSTSRTQAGMRTVRWSDAGTTDSWTPSSATTADVAILSSAESYFTGAVTGINDNALIFSRTGVYTMRVSGGIPVFTIQRSGGYGCQDTPWPTAAILPNSGHQQQAIDTPAGPFWVGADDFYLSGQGVGRSMWRFYRSRLPVFGGKTTKLALKLAWHPGRQQVMIPYQTVTSFAEPQVNFLCFNIVTKTWSRLGIPNIDRLVTHCVTTDLAQGLASPTYAHVLLLDINGTGYTGQSFYRESINGDVNLSNINEIQTKDFAIGTPPISIYVDRIKVDWEALPGMHASVAQLRVEVLARDELLIPPLVAIGSEGMETANNVQPGLLPFTVVGTQSEPGELPLRVRGKYVRFRFVAANLARIRIRGFTFAYREAGTYR